MKGKISTKLALFIFIVFVNTSFAQKSSKFKVVLDAGHGGKDYGAIYHGFIEKNIALNVVLKVGKILEKEPSIEVIYTRKTDVFIELHERANIANRSDADIFVSIHCNGAVNQSAFGTETFVMGITRNASNLEVAKKENAVVHMEADYKTRYKGYDPNSPESVIGVSILQEEYHDKSIALASHIEDGFEIGLKRKSRRVKAAGFLVLRDISMPRVLVELGFLSHKPEGAYLNSEAGQNALAKSVADAILLYRKELPGGMGNFEPVITRQDKPEITDVKPSPAVIATTEPIAQNTETPAAGGVVFKVQIAASGTDLELRPSNFNGLSPVSKNFDGKRYKYFYGETNDYNKARAFAEEAKAKGYPSAFLVAFDNGKSITVQEALKKR